MPITKQMSRYKLLEAAVAIVHDELHEAVRGPEMHSDAQADLLEDRLLISAREYVEAHADKKPVPG